MKRVGMGGILDRRRRDEEFERLSAEISQEEREACLQVLEDFKGSLQAFVRRYKGEIDSDMEIKRELIQMLDLIRSSTASINCSLSTPTSGTITPTTGPISDGCNGANAANSTPTPATPNRTTAGSSNNANGAHPNTPTNTITNTTLNHYNGNGHNIFTRSASRRVRNEISALVIEIFLNTSEENGGIYEIDNLISMLPRDCKVSPRDLLEILKDLQVLGEIFQTFEIANSVFIALNITLTENQFKCMELSSELKRGVTARDVSQRLNLSLEQSTVVLLQMCNLQLTWIDGDLGGKPFSTISL